MNKKRIQFKQRKNTVVIRHEPNDEHEAWQKRRATDTRYGARFIFHLDRTSTLADAKKGQKWKTYNILQKIILQHSHSRPRGSDQG